MLARDLWPTWADANQVESALLNLAINARDAMPEGGRLTVETSNTHLDAAYVGSEPGLQPGDYVMLAVTDTGTGMPPDVLARAFEPFFTTKPVGQGTGLGLSQLYGFARQSGGHVRIESEVGRGTSVKLYLPRHHGAEETKAARDASPEPPPPAPGQGTILVVEDEAIVRMLLVDALGGAGVHGAGGRQRKYRAGYRHLAGADRPAGDRCWPARYQWQATCGNGPVTAAGPEGAVSDRLCL